MPAALESTGNVQGDNWEDIPPELVEQITPVPPIETTTSNNEELLDAGSGSGLVLEIVVAKLLKCGPVQRCPRLEQLSK